MTHIRLNHRIKYIVLMENQESTVYKVNKHNKVRIKVLFYIILALLKYKVYFVSRSCTF